MASYTTVCDNPKCLRESRVSVTWATCRKCGSHVCDQCVEIFSAHAHEAIIGGGLAVVVFTVQCVDCLNDHGLDDKCDGDAALRSGFDEAYERANLVYKDQTGSEL